MSTAVLGGPVARRTNSDLVEAVRRSNSEIERRGRALLSNGDGLTGEDLMRYCALASDIGYGKMETTGRRILNEGGTFPAMRITTLLKHGKAYALRAVEESTGIEFTLLCEESLRQYEGDDIDLGRPNALGDYMREQVTIDVARKGSGYKAVMIGLSKDVLEYNQDVRLDLIR